MDNQYEEEINLITLLLKVCQRWRAMLNTAAVAAVVIGCTKLAMNIQGINDAEKMEKLIAAYNDAVGSYEAEGEALQQRIDDNQRNLRIQSEYNDSSMLMKVDPVNEWRGTMNLYIDTDYQIMPESSIQNENPAYKIAYAYYDYYAGAFYTDVFEKLSFDMIELKYLKEVLGVSIDANRYSITISVVADTKEHCDEIMRAAEEAFRSRYDFVKSSLGEHSLKVSDAISYAQINLDREQYQIDREKYEKQLVQNGYTLNDDYREWELREDEIEEPIIDLAGAVKNGIKWILIAGVGGGALSFAALFIKYMFSGRIKSADDLGRDIYTLAELPARGKKKNAIDRFICRLFGVVVKESEYDSCLEAMTLSLEKMLGAMEREVGTIAFVGDVGEADLKDFVKQVGETLSTRYKVVAAGDIITEPAAAKAAYDADAVVLVAEQDMTLKKNYAQMYSKLSTCRVEVLGAVLLGAESI